jgi:hypothetical protein
MSIGQFVRQCVIENSDLKNQEILDKVLEKFPEAKTTISCIAWYKTDMRKKGLIGSRSGTTKEGITKEIEVLEKRLATLKAQLATMEEQAEEQAEEQTTEEQVTEEQVAKPQRRKSKVESTEPVPA